MGLPIDPNLTGGYMASNLENDSYSMDYCVVGETCPSEQGDSDVSYRLGRVRNCRTDALYSRIRCGDSFYIRVSCGLFDTPKFLRDGSDRFGCFKSVRYCWNDYYCI